jgi:hypothetical protein
MAKEGNDLLLARADAGVPGFSEAEGTGIGCYFDDLCHDWLGMRDDKFQDLYHFTVGGPVENTRLLTLPTYTGR